MKKQETAEELIADICEMVAELTDDKEAYKEMEQRLSKFDIRSKQRLVVPKGEPVPVPENWPVHGPNFNSWNDDLIGFITILDAVKGEGFWTSDSQLKYLRVNIDTRDMGFVLRDRDDNVVSPVRVIEAINKNRDFFHAE